jgi:MFS family permease
MLMSPVEPAVKIRRGDVRRSLRASLVDGAFCSVMMGLVENFFIPFGLALRATVAQIGALAALPPLAGALCQWWTATLARHFGGRKSLLLRVVYGQIASLVLLAALPWVHPAWRVPALTALVAAYVAFGGLAGPVWNSLMSEYVPPARRAGYFGWRNRLMGTIVLSSALLTGLTLHFLAGGERVGRAVLPVFSAVMLAAAVCRAVSAAYLARYYEPALSARTMPHGRFLLFRAQTRGGPFWRFLAFNASLTLVANLVGPYFSVYMLKDLGFSYVTYTLSMVTLHLSVALMMPRWGRKADEAGVHKVLRVCAWLTPVLPLLWMLGRAPAYVVAIQVAGGWVWSGLNLCQTTYVIESVPSRLRTQAMGYFNVVNGLALFAGAALGGFLPQFMPKVFGYSFVSMLLLSSALRALVCATLLPRVGPVRVRPDVSDWQLFYSAVGLRPLAGIYRGAWQLLGR